MTNHDCIRNLQQKISLLEKELNSISFLSNTTVEVINEKKHRLENFRYKCRCLQIAFIRWEGIYTVKYISSGNIYIPNLYITDTHQQFQKDSLLYDKVTNEVIESLYNIHLYKKPLIKKKYSTLGETAHNRRTLKYELVNLVVT
jgi:hypothetical protein